MGTKTSNAELKFKAFSDRTRLRILYLLQEGEMCVCDIAEIIDVPQPTASRHLAYLRKAGLVSFSKKGLWAYYSLTKATSALHNKLLDCLPDCLDEIAEIRRDASSRNKRRRAANCC
jgi:ArsR family transcriptional regulator